MAVGQITLFLSELPSVAAKVMVNRPSGPIRRESQHWQYSWNSAHPCCSCSSLGHCTPFFAR